MKLIPKNWASFQHYRDRAPPWIKLHRDLLDDRRYQCLPVASRALAPMLWLLAAESKDGIFDGSLEELAFRLRAKSEAEIQDGLAPLIEAGFFEPVAPSTPTSPALRERPPSDLQALCDQAASALLEDCPQPAIPETETEGETEAEAEADGKNSGAAEPSSAGDNCPHQKIIDVFHEVLPAARRVREWTPARQQALRARWREKAERQDINWWRNFFGYVASSDFLCGRAPTAPGRKPFELTLHWICKSENFAKTLEGAYEN